LFDNPNHHRESGTDAISLHRDEGTKLRDLWIAQSIFRMVRSVLS